jgi:Fur family ferric uptake transcriptional regulator
VEHEIIRARFEAFLRTRSLKLTSQREAIFERAFATHEHFTAETLHRWMTDEQESSSKGVSRATVYRTLGLLEEAGFIGSLDSGRGELMYEHLLGHEHHDHLVCSKCGKIEEFRNDTIESLQEQVAKEHGFVLLRHSLRLEGHCRDCAKVEGDVHGGSAPLSSKLA